MGQLSKIEWTDRTWNPVTGCTKVSQGCKNCYAERIYERFNGHNSFRNVTCHEDRLSQPLKWKKPARVFVNSMSDLFHENVPFEFIDNVFAVMAVCDQHNFQVLTKRAQRMLQYFEERRDWRVSDLMVAYSGSKYTLPDWPLPNVWLGVSVEDQKAADERIPLLLQVPAAVRFLSCEPLLDSVSFRWAAWHDYKNNYKPIVFEGRPAISRGEYDGIEGIHWVIAGGESGPGARPMHPDWARTLRDQCKDARIPFFFKQWGEYMPAHALQCNEFKDKQWHSFDPETSVVKVGKKAAGRLLDGKEYNEFPQTK